MTNTATRCQSCETCRIPADERITYRLSGGNSPDFTVDVCPRHLRAELGRIYPHPFTTAPIGA